MRLAYLRLALGSTTLRKRVPGHARKFVASGDPIYGPKLQKCPLPLLPKRRGLQPILSLYLLFRIFVFHSEDSGRKVTLSPPVTYAQVLGPDVEETIIWVTILLRPRRKHYRRRNYDSQRHGCRNSDIRRPCCSENTPTEVTQYVSVACN